MVRLHMKRPLKIALSLLCFFALVISVVYYCFFVSMSFLPKGVLIGSYGNDKATCEVKVYECSSGATVDDAIRGEVVFASGKKRTIYWSYHESTADVTWVDSETVNINGHVLNVYKDKYDWRRE